MLGKCKICKISKCVEICSDLNSFFYFIPYHIFLIIQFPLSILSILNLIFIQIFCFQCTSVWKKKCIRKNLALQWLLAFAYTLAQSSLPVTSFVSICHEEDYFNFLLCHFWAAILHKCFDFFCWFISTVFWDLNFQNLSNVSFGIKTFEGFWRVFENENLDKDISSFKQDSLD